MMGERAGENVTLETCFWCPERQVRRFRFAADHNWIVPPANPATTHAPSGEKATLFTPVDSCPSRRRIGFAVVGSQMWIVPEVSPDATREPSGRKATLVT